MLTPPVYLSVLPGVSLEAPLRPPKGGRKPLLAGFQLPKQEAVVSVVAIAVSTVITMSIIFFQVFLFIRGAPLHPPKGGRNWELLKLRIRN